MDLRPEEARVLGSLIEKQLTTPQQYPLTVNALLTACNQTSNRNPVVSFGERDVLSALDDLKQRGLVRFVHPSHGRSVIRYRQVLEEAIGLSLSQVALVAILLLRGPQTAGELRSRTERMVDFATLASLEDELQLLTRWSFELATAGPNPPTKPELAQALVRRMTRQPGQKEERWVELLSRPRMSDFDSWRASAAPRSAGEQDVPDAALATRGIEAQSIGAASIERHGTGPAATLRDVEWDEPAAALGDLGRLPALGDVGRAEPATLGDVGRAEPATLGDLERAQPAVRPADNDGMDRLVGELQSELRDLRMDLADLRDEVSVLRQELDDLREDLGS